MRVRIGGLAFVLALVGSLGSAPAAAQAAPPKATKPAPKQAAKQTPKDASEAPKDAPKPAAPKDAAPKPAAPKTAPKADKAKSEPKAPPPKKAGKSKSDKPKPKPREAGSKPGRADDLARSMVSGDPPAEAAADARESDELKAMRELDQELFPPAPAPESAPWSTSLRLPEDGPVVEASGLPSGAPPAATAEGAAAAEDTSWIAALAKPDFPVRFEPTVVRYLQFYKNDPRGRALLQSLIKKSGRYREGIVKLLREQQLPEDVLWLVAVESAFDAEIESHAGAAGLWQFMPATGRIYGLTVNRRVDERLDPERSTIAAVKHLQDLHQRFGTWELAFAAYNMGYGGLLASIRKYNTNDYWELRRLEAGLPYESALYVPKIMAIAIAARNCKVFGCADTEIEAALPFGDRGADKVSVAPGVTLEDVAEAVAEKPERIAALNPHVIGSRLPPLQQATVQRSSWTVYVPSGKGAKAAATLPGRTQALKLGTHEVRWGEPITTVAAAYATGVDELEQLNDLYPGESPRPGTVIFVPDGRSPRTLAETARELHAVAIVPDQRFAYQGRRRVFYEPIFGDTLDDVARLTGASASEVRRWNHLDGEAKLQEGMRLQVFVPAGAQPDGVVLFEEPHVTVLEVGSPEFYAHYLEARGRQRLEVTAAAGESWKSLSARFGVTLGELERINQKSRSSKLQAGDRVVVYARRPAAAQPQPAAPAPADDTPRAPEDAADTAIAATPAAIPPGGDVYTEGTTSGAPAAKAEAPNAP
jgi:peptidoglycan lytic transglycosylase D